MLNKAVDLDTFGLKWNWIEWFGKPFFATIFATASQIFATSVPFSCGWGIVKSGKKHPKFHFLTKKAILLR